MDRDIKRHTLKVYTFVCLLGAVFFLSARQNEQELFLQANEAYKQSDFQKSLDLYTSLASPGAIVFYNMGNARYKLNSYAKALWCWRMAQTKADPSVFRLAQHNIDKVQIQMGIEEPAKWYDSIVFFMKYYSTFFSLFILQIVFLILWAVFLFFPLFFSLRRYFLFYGILATFSFCLLSLAYVVDGVKNPNAVIVVQQPAPMYVGMNRNFDVKRYLRAGKELPILEKNGEWYKVQTMSLTGWIPQEFVLPV